MTIKTNTNHAIHVGECIKNFVRLGGISAFFVVVSLTLGGCANMPYGSSHVETQPGSSASYNLRQQAARAYQESRWIEAVRLYQNVVEQVPTDADAWFRLGNTYAQQGAFQRAIHAYENSLTHNSEQPKAWFNLSTAYLLNAQSAMRSAHAQLRSGDPAKGLIAERLHSLNGLVHGRFEDGVSPAVY